MALIDELLKQVDGKALRAALVKEVETLRERASFGLVFEKHIPEIAVVTGAPIRPNMIVRRRDQPDSDDEYLVETVTARTAQIQPLRGNGPSETLPLKLLASVKRFGDPVFPGLRSVGRVRRSKTRPTHTVINGENFHALQLLEVFGESSIDCIFIDPPYNTGARDWKYNNAYVDAKDAWRHSKWLSMMEKRLAIAKRLLRDDGVLIITIDEHEFHHLGMLIEQEFPEYDQYAVSIVTNARGSTGTRNFGVIEERAVFVVPRVGYDLIQPRESFIADVGKADEPSDLEELLIKLLRVRPELVEELASSQDGLEEHESELLEDVLLELDEPEPGDAAEAEAPTAGEYWRGAVRTGQATSFRTQRPRQFYPIYVNPSNQTIVRVGDPLLAAGPGHPLPRPSWEEVDGVLPVWPIDEEGRERVWCFRPARMWREAQAGNLKVGRFNPRRNTYAINVRRLRRTERRFRERTIWWEKSYDAGSNGTNILKNLLGESEAFPFPKSIYAVRDALATVVGSRPDAVILDFFAGSATTFHATCLLNAIDGGARRSILVTNNEVDASTAERLVAEGHFPGDPEYERHGIFERVAMPRVKAVVEGQRADGTPLRGRHKWAGRRPFAEGFEENVEFFELTYLDPDDVELGRCFREIYPLLWLAAGGRSPMRAYSDDTAFGIDPAAGYALLFNDSKLRAFETELAKHESISYIFHVTNDPGAFAELVSIVGPDRRTVMLYRDYLLRCRSNVQVAS